MTEAKELDPAVRLNALDEAIETLRFNVRHLIAEDDKDDALRTLEVARDVMASVAETLASLPRLEALSTAPVALEVSEERGWLIELRGHVPTWFALDAAEGEHGWTNDSLKALRFGRKADADAYISDIGWTEAFASEHSWSDSSPRRHVWWEWHNLTCCKTCGIVRRADGGNDNGVCKGAAKIGLRSAIHPAPSREAVIEVGEHKATIELMQELAVAYALLLGTAMMLALFIGGIMLDRAAEVSAPPSPTQGSK